MLPFRFRYPSVMRESQMVVPSVFCQVSCYSSVTLPLSFRFASFMRVSQHIQDINESRATGFTRIAILIRISKGGPPPPTNEQLQMPQENSRASADLSECFSFRSASVFLPLCGNLRWSFRMSFAECHVTLPLRFRYPSVLLPLWGWATNTFKTLTNHGPKVSRE